MTASATQRIAVRIDPRFMPAAPAAATPSRGAAGGPRFELARGPQTSRGPAGARSSAPLATLDAILALQGGDEDPADRKRRSARRGQGLLAALDGLKVALIAGRVSPSDLGRIAASLSGAGPSGDPGLDEVIAQIELRAKVELAKLGRADLA